MDPLTSSRLLRMQAHDGQVTAGDRRVKCLNRSRSVVWEGHEVPIFPLYIGDAACFTVREGKKGSQLILPVHVRDREHQRPWLHRLL